MKKQIVLSAEEYNSLITIAKNATILVDKYVEKANKSRNAEACHIMDSKKADENQVEIYHKILYLEPSIRVDIEKLLPENYYDLFPFSVLNDDTTDF